jgi:hypothetical protein
MKLIIIQYHLKYLKLISNFNLNFDFKINFNCIFILNFNFHLGFINKQFFHYLKAIPLILLFHH